MVYDHGYIMSWEIYSRANQLIQSGKISEARELVADPETPTYKIIEAHIYHKLNEFDKSRKITAQIVSNTSINLDDRLIAYYWYAWNYLSEGDYSSTLAIIEEGLNLVELSETDHKRGTAYLYNVKGTTLKESGDIENAQYYTEKGLEMAKQTDDLRLVGAITNNLASTYFFKGDYRNSLSLFFDAAEAARQCSNPYVEAVALSNIGELYQYLAEIQLAKQYLYQALRVNTSIDNQSGIAACHRKLGEIAFQLNNFEDARPHLQESIEIYQDLGNKFYLCLSYFAMIKLLLNLQEDIDGILIDMEIVSKGSKNPLLIQIYNLTEAIVLKNQTSLLKRGQAMIYLEKIIYAKILHFEITYEATLHYIDLLIQEYLLTEDNHKLDQIISLVTKIYTQAVAKNATIKIIESLILRSKLYTISLQIDRAIENLQTARKIAIKNDLEEFTKSIDEEIDLQHEELNRYQQLVDDNASLIDKIEESGLVDYINSLVPILKHH